MRTILVLLSFYLGFGAAAQNRCVTVDYSNTIAAGTFLKMYAKQKNISDTAVVRIPVVVHLLYNDALQDISNAQIRSGIEALNRDFRRKATDTINTPAQFKNLAADVKIEFHLATADPLGRKTDGIVRKQTTRNGWTADDRLKSAAQGGDDPWDTKNYLNIWVVNLIGGSGYATMPGSAAEVDGVVIHFGTFGTINTASPFNWGRTAVHEVGHWLGLKHIWGDAPCGDDGIDDTPTQSFFTKGCPADFRTSCGNDATGDMYMNFMDYTDDACMNMFTQGQRSRMRNLFAEGGWRESLLQSKGLAKPWADEASLPESTALLYPNPAKEKITVHVSSSLMGKALHLLNGQGQWQKTIVVSASQQIVPVAELKPGIYFLKGEGFLQKFTKL